MLMKEHFPYGLICYGQYVKQNTMVEGVEFHVSTDEKAEAAVHAINNHDKMAEMLTLHRSIFVHMLENISPTATIEDVEKVQDLVAQIDEVLGNE